MLARLREIYLRKGTVEKIEHRTDLKEEGPEEAGREDNEGAAARVAGYARALAALNRTAEPDPAVQETVAEIIAAIRKRGDAALLEYTARFGGPTLQGEEFAGERGGVLGRRPSSVDERTRKRWRSRTRTCAISR